MIDNRFYTVLAATIAQDWWSLWYQAMCQEREGLDALEIEIEKALVDAEERGFKKGLAQRDSETLAKAQPAIEESPE
jgi:hypothetical protein